MARGRKGSGVEPRENHIRVGFTLDGERCREPLDLAPTPPNLKYAARLVEDIRRAIDRGTFKYEAFFPNSERAKRAPAGAVSLAERGALWLGSKGRLSSATLSQYGNALAFWYEILGGRDTDVRTIAHSTVASKIGAHPWPSAKLCNNYLIPLRGLFALSVRDKVIPEDPLEGIENSETQAPLPDPYTLDEAEALLADLFKHYPETIGNYFEVAFFNGPRPEEEIALRWTDWDSELGHARIERARSFRGELKDVKGRKARDIELVYRSEEALQRQKKITFMKPHGFIFENPVTGKPFHDERSQRDHYWTPAHRRTGIRYRTPYHTRHTFATLAIMNDCNPTWVATQMGNSVRVIYKHYAKWIERADKSRQKAKFEAGLRGEFVPNLSPEEGNAGRRDWTRTTPIEGRRGGRKA
jgi:integrase